MYLHLVLIVAKCIVNKEAAQYAVDNLKVLIVAKCIVNTGNGLIKSWLPEY